MLVIWDWELLSCDSENTEESAECESDYNSDEKHQSDPEDDQRHKPASRHTVTFKVIGCTKEPQYQSTLLWARDSLEQGGNVKVELTPEPSNPYNPKAIAFRCLKDGSFIRIGYVVNEIVSDVHNALVNNEVVAVEFKWIKYVCDWTRSGPGYFAGVDVTKVGRWPAAVVRAASTR